jgi:predicted PurR-regulated permease PerM
MTQNSHARSEDESPPPAAAAPVVVVNGLGYRDLQRAILFSAALFLLYQAAGPAGTLLLFFLMVFILAAVLNPAVAWLERRGWPRILGAAAIIGGVLAIFVIIGWLAVPPLLNELRQFFGNLDEKQERLVGYYNDLSSRYPELASQLPPPGEIVQMLTPKVTALLGQLGRYTMNAVVGIVMVVLMLVLVLFTVSNPVPLVVGLLSAVPDRHRERTANALRRVMEQLKNWAVGSLVLGVIIGIMTGAGLWGLGMATGHPFPYVLLFSVIAGIGEMIPNIGPVVSAVPPALVALTIDPMLGIWVLVLFLVIQQLENNLIVPVVMGQSLDLHPLSVTFTVLVMGALFGLIGAIIAVPVCAIVKVCWQEFYLAPRHPNVEAIAAQAEALLNLPGTTGVASEKLEKQTQDAVAEAESTTRP